MIIAIVSNFNLLMLLLWLMEELMFSFLVTLTILILMMMMIIMITLYYYYYYYYYFIMLLSIIIVTIAITLLIYSLNIIIHQSPHSAPRPFFSKARLIHVPAADHPAGSKRPIFFTPEPGPWAEPWAEELVLRKSHVPWEAVWKTSPI